MHHGKKLLFVWTPELLSLNINAINDQLTSPANLKQWGETDLGLSQLCHHHHCTLLHILNGCSHSLQDGRYNWHHDQTLRAIASGLAPYVKAASIRKGLTSEFNNFFPTIAFCTADGTTYRNPVLPYLKTEAKTY